MGCLEDETRCGEVGLLGADSSAIWQLLQFRQRSSMVLVALMSSLVGVGVAIDVTMISKTWAFTSDFPYVVILMFLVGLRWLWDSYELLNMAIRNIDVDKTK